MENNEYLEEILLEQPSRKSHIHCPKFLDAVATAVLYVIVPAVLAYCVCDYLNPRKPSKPAPVNPAVFSSLPGHPKITEKSVQQYRKVIETKEY